MLRQTSSYNGCSNAGPASGPLPARMHPRSNLYADKKGASFRPLPVTTVRAYPPAVPSFPVQVPPISAPRIRTASSDPARYPSRREYSSVCRMPCLPCCPLLPFHVFVYVVLPWRLHVPPALLHKKQCGPSGSVHPLLRTGSAQVPFRRRLPARHICHSRCCRYIGCKALRRPRRPDFG